MTASDRHADELEAAGRWVARSRTELARATERARNTAIDAYADLHDGMTPTEIAAALGVTRVTVYRWLGHDI